MFIAMLEEYSKNKEKYDLKSLRTGIIAGAGVPEALMYRIKDELGI
jgi:acyl-CoA synthetase (AMP-forming)/AMP-acid ligase II